MAQAPSDLPSIQILGLDAELPAAVLQVDDAAMQVYRPAHRIGTTDWVVRVITRTRLVLEHPNGDQLWVDGADGSITRVTAAPPPQAPVQDWVIREAEIVDGAPPAPSSGPASEVPQP